MNNKEKIEKLFEARNETAIAEPNWAICQSLINQVITALKAEPKVNLWFVKDYLKKALNRWDIDAKHWVEQALCEFDKLRGITHGDSAIAIIEGLEAELAEANKRIELALLELANIEGEKTPTEIRVEQALAEQKGE